MSLYDAYGSREIGGWCTPKVTLEGPAALLRSCHLQPTPSSLVSLLGDVGESPSPSPWT